MNARTFRILAAAVLAHDSMCAPMRLLGPSFNKSETRGPNGEWSTSGGSASAGIGTSVAALPKQSPQDAPVRRGPLPKYATPLNGKMTGTSVIVNSVSPDPGIVAALPRARQDPNAVVCVLKTNGINAMLTETSYTPSGSESHVTWVGTWSKDFNTLTMHADPLPTPSFAGRQIYEVPQTMTLTLVRDGDTLTGLRVNNYLLDSQGLVNEHTQYSGQPVVDTSAVTLRVGDAPSAAGTAPVSSVS